ncbi:MAG: hypothetical protein ACPGVT_04080 [Maricaulaceae bacterium]
MLNKFAQTKTLWMTFIGTIICFVLFGVISKKWGFSILDEISGPDASRALVASLTPTQNTVHIWMTATLDVIFPLIYGAFFAGMAHRFWGSLSKWLIIPTLIVVPTDLIEGVVQVLGLMGNDGILGLKSILTPLKLYMFYAAALIALSGLLNAGAGKLRGRA